jgi:ABC-2 type transport system permease protein
MLAILIKTIKDRLVSLAIYCLAAIGFIWIYIGFFPSFADQSEEFEKLIQSFPEGFMEAFGFEGSLFFDSIENFLATEMFSFVWPIMAIAIGVGIAGSAIAGAIAENHIETLLAQPISRTKIYFAKYFAGLFNLIVFVFVSIYSIIPLSAAYDISYQTDNYLLMTIVSLLFALSIYSLSFLISAISSSKGLVNFISVGLILLTYVINILANLKDSLENLQYFSFFYYFDPTKLLAQGELVDYTYLVFIPLIILTTLIGWYLFKKRDIAV